MIKKLLVLFLGNPILADDKIGLLLGEILKPILESEGHEVEILEKTGFSLIDHFQNRRAVVIVDSVKTDTHEVGEIFSVKPDNFQQYSPFTSHYVGIPETLKMMAQLDLNPPEEMHILGIEVEDAHTVSEEMSHKLTKRLNELCDNTHRKILSIARDLTRDSMTIRKGR